MTPGLVQFDNVSYIDKEKINFGAIRQGKIEMFKRFLAAKKTAERKGKIMVKPL
ncbi:hypothetical protein [Xenorhabdus nematophila]|nr:hypothetical protein [Xenorhabdus nematophila]CEF31599.1 hypothetical protein XNW1_3850095 [Xenorhabdus nematophila str. Websteri]